VNVHRVGPRVDDELRDVIHEAHVAARARHRVAERGAAPREVIEDIERAGRNLLRHMQAESLVARDIERGLPQLEDDLARRSALRILQIRERKPDVAQHRLRVGARRLKPREDGGRLKRRDREAAARHARRRTRHQGSVVPLAACAVSLCGRQGPAAITLPQRRVLRREGYRARAAGSFAMNRMQFKGRWVVVTGASSGLGREMAYQLAREHGANLVLVARRAARLREIALELESKAGVKVRVVEADLSREADVERVFTEATEQEIYAVILNAGVTHFGEHRDLTWTAFQAMLATNVTSVVRLASLFAPYLVARANEGGILLVASMAGLMPVPYQSAYSGTKAFLVHFGRAFAYELRGAPVSLSVFAPGGIDTELTESSGLGAHFKSSVTIMPADLCAREALRGFERRRELHVPGWFNQAGALLVRWLPQRLFVAAIGAEYKKALVSRGP